MPELLEVLGCARIGSVMLADDRAQLADTISRLGTESRLPAERALSVVESAPEFALTSRNDAESHAGFGVAHR